jgi:hypothetical protein
MTPSGERESPEGRVGETLHVNPDTPLIALSLVKYG